MLEEAKANEEREKLDAQTRAEAERDDARAKLEAAEARAAKVEHTARVHRMLMAEGVPADAVERVALMVTAEPGATDDDIKGDIDKIRDLGIGVFSTQTQTAPVARPSTPPSARTPTPGIDPARERARQRLGYKPVSAA
jgi:crotonobetainyl-CoA:carnitine CoA-transferase CaiB-like acyl-CoA transferase